MYFSSSQIFLEFVNIFIQENCLNSWIYLKFNNFFKRWTFKICNFFFKFKNIFQSNELLFKFLNIFFQNPSDYVQIREQFSKSVGFFKIIVGHFQFCELFWKSIFFPIHEPFLHNWWSFSDFDELFFKKNYELYLNWCHFLKIHDFFEFVFSWINFIFCLSNKMRSSEPGKTFTI